MRYAVERLPGMDLYGIVDRALSFACAPDDPHPPMLFCTLPDDPHHPSPNLLPLEWPNPRGAQEWLARCYGAWERGTVPAPEGWAGEPDPAQGPEPAQEPASASRV
ncbi:hypothetical protein [Streptomyces sp. NPDC088801]|uniref:hypothetical protein n=1 Tax=Streptomyces sp. NPDC088801 TaxID=3365903 RepID=UPI00381B117C